MGELTLAPTARPGQVMIHPWVQQSLGIPLFAFGLGTIASNNWIAANIAVFYPFWLPEPVRFFKMFWGNGAAVAGNIDVGMFAEDGTRLVSIGTTGQAGTARIQGVDIGDTTLARGRYYMGMTSDTSGATQKAMAILPLAGIPQSLGLLEMSAAPPFSANANPAVFAKYTRAFIPYFGAQGYRTLGP